MKTADALSHYGSKSAIAAALGINRQAVQQWGDVVPYHSATLVHHDSRGAVPLHPEHYGPGGRIVAGRAA